MRKSAIGRQEYGANLASDQLAQWEAAKASGAKVGTTMSMGQSQRWRRFSSPKAGLAHSIPDEITLFRFQLT